MQLFGASSWNKQGQIHHQSIRPAIHLLMHEGSRLTIQQLAEGCSGGILPKLVLSIESVLEIRRNSQCEQKGKTESWKKTQPNLWSMHQHVDALLHCMGIWYTIYIINRNYICVCVWQFDLGMQKSRYRRVLFALIASSKNHLLVFPIFPSIHWSMETNSDVCMHLSMCVTWCALDSIMDVLA